MSIKVVSGIRQWVRKYRKGIRLWLLFVCVVLLAAAVLVFWLSPLNYDTLLLVTPALSTEHGVDTDDLEDINDEKFMITYTCSKSAAAEAVNTRKNVAILATNYTYPYVMRYVMKSGGFFTSAHQQQKYRAAVLNEKAAFELFGGIDIIGNEITFDGVKYTAVGVIDDKDAEFQNIYIPITLTSDRPNAFAVRLSDSVSEAYVKNELKQLGITESNYEFTRATIVDRLLDMLK